MNKGIYLGSCRANHPAYNIVYQDIDGKRDIGGENVHKVIEKWLAEVNKIGRTSEQN